MYWNVCKHRRYLARRLFWDKTLVIQDTFIVTAGSFVGNTNERHPRKCRAISSSFVRADQSRNTLAALIELLSRLSVVWIMHEARKLNMDATRHVDRTERQKRVDKGRTARERSDSKIQKKNEKGTISTYPKSGHRRCNSWREGTKKKELRDVGMLC